MDVTFDGAVHGPARSGPPPASRRALERRVRAAGSGRLRLTRRGRVVVVALALLACLGGAWGGHAVADGPPRPQEVDVHIVSAGDTVWGLARAVAADGQDMRDVVAEILRLNAMSSADIAVGQRILLPKDG